MFNRLLLTATALLAGVAVTALWIIAIGPDPPYWWIGAILLVLGDLATIVAVWRHR
jgi:hypothetical protein